MSTFSWNTTSSADWSTPADWTRTGGSTLAPPGGAGSTPSTDIATIMGTTPGSPFTVSIATGETFDIDTLNYSSTTTSGAPTLSITGTLRLNTLAYSGTKAVTTTINSGGVLQVRTSITDTGSGQTIADNGTLTGVGSVASKVTLGGSGTIKASGGTLDLLGTVNSGPALAVDTTPGSNLKIDGTATAATAISINNANQTLEVGAAGALTITGGTQNVTLGTIKLDGGSLTDTSGISFGAAASNGTLSGFGTVTGALTRSGTGTADTIIATGGTLTLATAIGQSTGLVFDIGNSAASSLQLGASPSTGNTFTFLGSAGNLATATGVVANDTVAGLNVGASTTPTNFIDILNNGSVTVTSSKTGTGSAGTITLSNGDTFALSGITNGSGTWHVLTAKDSAGTGTDVFLSQVCYAAGTRILTATGERMVESLLQGDIVLTLSDGGLDARPVKWVGRRRIDLTAHPRPETVAPIRIRRGAIADNVPHTDLVVSPDHAILVDGKLICARQLVNGTTIRVETEWTNVEYFHVELDEHAILLAEGLPAESYLDTGNRGFFANSEAPRVLHPDLTDETDHPTRAAGSCAPFVWDEAGVKPVWQKLANRAATLGQPVPQVETTADPSPHLMAKGRTVRPIYGENGLYIFPLPKGATEVRLVSRAAAPTDTRPWLEDRRRLGLYVERIVLRAASEVREVPVDHPSLARGWWAVESSGAALRRWTDGDAVLPLPGLDGPAMLEVRAGTAGLSYPAGPKQVARAA